MNIFQGYTHTAGSKPQTPSVNQNAQSPEPEAVLKIVMPSSTTKPGHHGSQPGPAQAPAWLRAAELHLMSYRKNCHRTWEPKAVKQLVSEAVSQ